jgi:two-component system NarL family response regulator
MRVLLVDDNRLMLEGLTNLLEAHGIHVAGTAGDGLQATRSAQTIKPDLILMDIRMPVCDGLEATRRIKARQPEIKIVMLTTSAEEADLFESIKSGACGYLIKNMSSDAFIEALRGLEQGVPPFSPGLAAKLLVEFARLAGKEAEMGGCGEDDTGKGRRGEVEREGLTERQTEVLRLLASGLAYKEIAQRLSISERTVRFHMTEIMERLHLANRAQVLAYASKLDLK